MNSHSSLTWFVLKKIPFSQERKFAKAGATSWAKLCFLPTKSDGLVVAFRNWLRKYSNGQVPWGATSNQQLPPTPPREQLMDR